MLTRTFVIFALGLLASGALRVIHTSDQGAPLPAEDFWLQKTYPESLFDGVIVGNSRTFRGLSPAAMKASLPGLQLHNFGYSAARLTPDYLDAAEALLKPKGRSRFLVVGLTGHSLSRPKPGQPANPHLRKFTQTPAHEAWLRRRATVLASRWFPSLVADPTIDLQIALQGSGVVRYNKRFFPTGFVASDMVPRDPARVLAKYKKTLAAHPTSPAALSELVAWVFEARKRDLSIFVFEPPRPEATAQLELGLGRFDPERSKTLLKAAGAVWLDVPTQGMHSYDGSHLEPASAKVLSLALAQGIAASLKQP